MIASFSFANLVLLLVCKNFIQFLFSQFVDWENDFNGVSFESLVELSGVGSKNYTEWSLTYILYALEVV